MEKSKKTTDIVKIKGAVNSHKNAAPEFTTYENGNSRMTFNLVYKENGKDRTIDVAAYNSQAERIYANVKSNNIREYTLSGRIKMGSNGKEVLQVYNIIPHKVISIEGEIEKIDKTEDKGKTSTDVHLKINNQGTNQEEFYIVKMRGDKELNGAKLKKGETIAVSGLASFLENKQGERLTRVNSWTVAKDKQKLNELIATKQEDKEATKSSGQEMEM